MESVSTTARPDITACAAQSSTCALVSPPFHHTTPLHLSHTATASTSRQTRSKTSRDLSTIIQRRHTYLLIWTAHLSVQVDGSSGASSQQCLHWDLTASPSQRECCFLFLFNTPFALAFSIIIQSQGMHEVPVQIQTRCSDLPQRHLFCREALNPPTIFGSFNIICFAKSNFYLPFRMKPVFLLPVLIEVFTRQCRILEPKYISVKIL